MQYRLNVLSGDYIVCSRRPLFLDRNHVERERVDQDHLFERAALHEVDEVRHAERNDLTHLSLIHI